MSYRDVFPDFGDIDVSLPAGFHDCSDPIESCPSFENTELGLRIYIANASPDRREFPDNEARFRVWHRVAGRTLLLTDQWNEVEDFVARCKPTNVLLFDRWRLGRTH